VWQPCSEGTDATWKPSASRSATTLNSRPISAPRLHIVRANPLHRIAQSGREKRNARIGYQRSRTIATVGLLPAAACLNGGARYFPAITASEQPIRRRAWAGVHHPFETTGFLSRGPQVPVLPGAPAFATLWREAFFASLRPDRPCPATARSLFDLPVLQFRPQAIGERSLNCRSVAGPGCGSSADGGAS
jgi:hypothetical protein